MWTCDEDTDLGMCILPTEVECLQSKDLVSYLQIELPFQKLE